LAVHRGKSFLSTSKALGVATSTVARRIEAFERALGRPLVLSGLVAPRSMPMRPV
jgi:DNA-binding transcriptional LysR family regulator